MSDASQCDKGGDTTFQTDGRGRWWKRTSSLRCLETIFPFGQCQGILGHKNFHWRYSESGWLETKRPTYSSSTPPDHKKYVSPLQMQPFCHHSCGSDWIEVTDPVELKRLEADEMGDGEATIRPIA